MLDALEKMTLAQQQQFRDTANKLLSTTFLSKDKRDNKENYYFLMSYKEVFDEFFQILGYEITLDMPTGSVMLSGASSSNTLKLKRDESIILLILRLLYHEKMKDTSLNENIVCSVSDIHIKHKLRTSREWVLENMIKSVEFAKKNGLYVSVNGEDASRADNEFLVEFINEAKKAGANRFRYCDTVGIMEPFSIRKNIEELYKKTGFDIEMHTHNDFGMATANAIAGILGGASHVGLTVNGLGERAGNAALEEVLMALMYVYGYKADVNTKMFREVSEYVAQASGRELPIWNAIVGDNMFAHESGIHADGAIKNPKTYEAFDPDVVGLQRQIVIGKHSGKAGIINKLKEYNIELNDEEAKGILEMVRAASVRLKRTLFDKELVKLYKEYKRLNKEKDKEN